MRYLCLAAALFIQLAVCSRLPIKKRPLPSSHRDFTALPRRPSAEDTVDAVDGPEGLVRPTKRPRGNDYAGSSKNIDLGSRILEEEEGKVRDTDAVIKDIAEASANIKPAPAVHDAQPAHANVQDENGRSVRSDAAAIKVADAVPGDTDVAESTGLVDQQAPSNDPATGPALVVSAAPNKAAQQGSEAPVMHPWSKWKALLEEQKRVSRNPSTLSDVESKLGIIRMYDVLVEYSKPAEPPFLSSRACAYCSLLLQFEEFQRDAAIRVRGACSQEELVESDARLAKVCKGLEEWFGLPRSQTSSREDRYVLRMSLIKSLYSLVDDGDVQNTSIDSMLNQIIGYARGIFEREKHVLVNIQHENDFSASTQPEVAMQGPDWGDSFNNAQHWSSYREALEKKPGHRQTDEDRLAIEICRFSDLFKEFDKAVPPFSEGNNIHSLVLHMGVCIRDTARWILNSTGTLTKSDFEAMTGNFSEPGIRKLSRNLPACFLPHEISDYRIEELVSAMIKHLYVLSLESAGKDVDFEKGGYISRRVRVQAVNRLARRLFIAEKRVASQTADKLPKGSEMELAQRPVRETDGLDRMADVTQVPGFRPHAPHEQGSVTKPAAMTQKAVLSVEKNPGPTPSPLSATSRGESAFVQTHLVKATGHSDLDGDAMDISVEDTADASTTTTTSSTLTVHDGRSLHVGIEQVDGSDTALRAMATNAALLNQQGRSNSVVTASAPVTTTTSTASMPSLMVSARDSWIGWKERLLEEEMLLEKRKPTNGNGATYHNFLVLDLETRFYVYQLYGILAEYSKPVKPPSFSPYACPGCYLLHQFEKHLRKAAIRVRDEYIQTGLEVDVELVRLCADPPKFFELPQRGGRESATTARTLRMKMARHIHSLVDKQSKWNAPINVVFDEITSYSRAVFKTEKLCLANTQPEVVAQAPVCNDRSSNADLWAVYRASLGEEVLAKRDPSLKFQLDVCKYLDVFKEFNKTIPCPPEDHLYVLVHHMGASIRDAAVLISKSIRDVDHRRSRTLAGEFTKKWLARLSSDLPVCFAPPEDLDPQTKERNIDGMIDYLYKSSFKNPRNIDFTQEPHSLKTVRINEVNRFARNLFEAEKRAARRLPDGPRVQVME